VVGWAGVIFVGWHVLSVMFIAPAVKKVVAADGDGGVPTATAADAFKAGEEVHFDIQADYGDLDKATIFKRAASYFAWLLFFFGTASIVGLLPAMFLYLVGYMRFVGKESWRLTLYVAVPMWLLSYALFHKILFVPWPQTVIGDMFPALRSNIWFNLF
jgi:hypothetical protein